MKRFIATAAVCLALVAWSGSAVARTWPSMVEWGPGGTLNGATSPTYALPIPVLDGIRDTVPAGERRRDWVRIRNAAIDEWGIPWYPVNAPDIAASIDPMTWVPPSGMITLVRSQVYDGRENIIQGVWTGDAGIVWLSLDRGWRNRSLDGPAVWQSFVAHEIGHALGFGHPYADPDEGCPYRWVMACGYHVSDEERAVARAYYGGDTDGSA